MRRARQFICNAAILTGTSLLVRMVSVSFSVYIAKQIGPEGMGIFQLITTVYMFATTLATSGIHLTTTRLVTEELAQGNAHSAKSALNRCLFYSGLCGGCASLLLSCFAPRIASVWLHGRVSAKPLYALCLSLPFLSLSSVWVGYFTALRSAGKTASSQVWKQIIKIVVTLYLLRRWIVHGLDAACLALVLGDVLSECGAFCYLLLLYLMDRRRRVHAQSRKGLTRKMLEISLPIALSSYVRSALVTLKQVLIPSGLEKSGLSCDEAIAQYGLIGGMVMPVLMFPSVLLTAVSTLLIPEVSERHVQHRDGQIQRMLARIFKITLLFSICVAGVLLTFAEPLSLWLYGSTQAAFYIRLLAPLVVIMYFDEIVDAILKGLNEQVCVVGINILDTLVGICMIQTLLPVQGLEGYVLVIFVTETLNGLLSIRRLCRVAQFRIEFFWWIAIPSLAVLLAGWVIRFLGVGNLFFCIAGCVLGYIALLFACGALQKSDFRL